MIKVETQFIEEISGLAIIKVLVRYAHCTMMLKLKFVQNSAALDLSSTSLDTIVFDLGEVLGILDLRFLGYYKIKQSILQQNLSKYYRFESSDVLCEQFNIFINTLKKENQVETNEKNP